MVLFFLKESLTKDMRVANEAERKKSRARYQELKAIIKSNSNYVPSVDDRYILRLNEGGYLSLITQKNILISCIIYGILTLFFLS